MGKLLSISEENGLKAIPADAITIYSVGVSTAGEAEVRMAQGDPRRNIIATTIDDAGVKATQKLIQEQGFESQIKVRNEDVSQSLSYADETFDYIYARLVLHYLTRQQLEVALHELYRTLKTDGRIFIVVRSDRNIDATQDVISYNEQTGMTRHVAHPNKDVSEERERFFHSVESLTEFVTKAGFTIIGKTQYDEKLFHDYDRLVKVDYADNLIEIIAQKP